MVYACFFFCCLFAPGALLCVNVTDKVQSLCPFYNQTVEGYLPEIDRTRIIFHFRPLFQARCSPLTNTFFAQVSFRYVCLLEFSCPAVMFAFPFTRPATTFFAARFSMARISWLQKATCTSKFMFISTVTNTIVFSSIYLFSMVDIFVSFRSVYRSFCFLVLLFYCIGPAAFYYTWFSLKRLICCKQSAPDQERAVPRFTENSVSFSSPSQAPSSPQDQPPDHPPPPPPLPLKQKHWNTVNVNTQNTTLNATADLH